MWIDDVGSNGFVYECQWHFWDIVIVKDKLGFYNYIQGLKCNFMTKSVGELVRSCDPLLPPISLRVTRGNHKSPETPPIPPPCDNLSALAFHLQQDLH